MGTEAEEALRVTSTSGLLRAAYALTHRIDAGERTHQPGEGHRVRNDLRAQRDLIDAEILRREREAATLLRTARPSHRSPQSWYRRRTEALR